MSTRRQVGGARSAARFDRSSCSLMTTGWNARAPRGLQRRERMRALCPEEEE